MLIYLLLIIYQIKHLLADGPLQVEFMLAKFKDKDWAMPLAAHAGVHAGFTLLIVGIVSQNPLLTLGCAALDFSIHFTVDRIKASPKLLGRFKAMTKDDYEMHNIQIDLLISANKRKTIDDVIFERKKNKLTKNFDDVKKNNNYFWWSLLADQALHHITHYGIIFLTLYYR